MNGFLSSMRKPLAVFASSTLVLTTITGPAPAYAQPRSQTDDPKAAQCEALTRFNIEQIADSPGNIVEARFVAGKQATPNDQRRFSARGITQGIPVPKMDAWPDHCLVEGYITPHVKFAMMLPPAGEWNNRFWLAACEGWCGRVNMDTMAPAFHHGYAVITNNGGHYGSLTFDAIWAHRNLEARINFAHRADHVSAQVGKAIIEAYYGAEPKFSYIAGVSKGGNAGLFAAQRYPEDFDGVISKAPVVNYNPKNAAHMPWIAKAVYPDGKTPVIYSDKVPLIHNAVNEACDAIDGLEDGVIDDPRKCDFDPAVLLCKPGQSEADNECLNPAQVDAVTKIYAKPTSDDGVVYFDYPNDPGSEHEWSRVILPMPGDTHTPAFYDGAVSGHYMAFKNNPAPGYDWMNFDYTKHTAEIAEMSQILDPDNPDLTEFKARGGKMIVLHGWSDGYISANMTIDYFESVQAFMGGAEETAEFAQLYLLPGVHHVFAGPGPHIVDAHTALVKWVEEGDTPDRLMARKEQDDGTSWTRPLYPYPYTAKYKGSGDIFDAESFEKALP